MAGPVRRTRDRTSTPGRPDDSRPNLACQPTPPDTPTSGLAVDLTLLTHPPDPVESRTEPCWISDHTLLSFEPNKFPTCFGFGPKPSLYLPPEGAGSSDPARAKRRGQRLTPSVPGGGTEGRRYEVRNEPGIGAVARSCVCRRPESGTRCAGRVERGSGRRAAEGTPRMVSRSEAVALEALPTAANSLRERPPRSGSPNDRQPPKQNGLSGGESGQRQKTPRRRR